MEFIREDCIYARQSVDRKDSIRLFRQEYGQAGVSKAAGRDPQGKGPAGHRV